MYVGLDVSKNEIVCVGKDKEGIVLYEDKWGTSEEGIDSIIAHVGKESIFAVEPSTKGVFVYDSLIAKGMIVKVANPNKIKMISESEKKTDRGDASILADLLRTNMLPECYLPSRDMREVRDIIRHRKSIVDVRTILKNKIRAILSREGIDLECSDITGVEASELIERIEIKNEVQKEALDRLMRIAAILASEIDDYDFKISERYKLLKSAQLLDTIPGISYYSAVHITSAIVDIKRFPSDEELASYAGLVPKIFQSGETRIDKGLRHGDKLLRWILVQDAHAAIRSSKRFRRYYMKRRRKKGHQKAIVATARKMVEIIYVILTRGEPYSENYGK